MTKAKKYKQPDLEYALTGELDREQMWNMVNISYSMNP